MLCCVRTCTRLEWPVRTLSFTHDGCYLASGSEDQVIDIASVATGEQAHAIPTNAPMNSVAWHPTEHLLAYAGDEKAAQLWESRSWVTESTHLPFAREPRSGSSLGEPSRDLARSLPRALARCLFVRPRTWC